MITGPDGSAKNEVAKILEDDDFRIIKATPVQGDNDFEIQHHQMLSWYDLHMTEIQPNMKEQSLVQVRSFWDTHLVFTRALAMLDRISVKEQVMLDEMFSTLAPTLVPPNIVFNCVASNIDAESRLRLRGTQHIDEDLEAIRRRFYEEYVKRIRVPVVDIEIVQDWAKVTDQVRFGMASMDTTRLSTSTVWNRRMLR
jgi:hypothetical protein